MKLVVMTKPTFFVEEDKILTSLFEEGLDNLHLCKPDAMPVFSERLLTLLPEEVYGKIAVHNHFYLKDEYKLRAIHLEGASTELPQGYKGHFSRSCRKADDLKEAKRKADYVVFEGTFSTPEGIKEAREAERRGLIDRKVYAAGGITPENVRIAREMGFGGVVACQDLWSRFEIHSQQDYKDLMAHFERMRKAAG